MRAHKRLAGASRLKEGSLSAAADSSAQLERHPRESTTFDRFLASIQKTCPGGASRPLPGAAGSRSAPYATAPCWTCAAGAILQRGVSGHSGASERTWSSVSCSTRRRRFVAIRFAANVFVRCSLLSRTPDESQYLRFSHSAWRRRTPATYRSRSKGAPVATWTHPPHQTCSASGLPRGGAIFFIHSNTWPVNCRATPAKGPGRDARLSKARSAGRLKEKATQSRQLHGAQRPRQ